MQSFLVLAATFNLVCSGTSTRTNYDGERRSEFAYEFRVDLDNGYWCSDDCRIVKHIAEVHPGFIFFEHGPLAPALDGEVDHWVNRETGEYSMLATSGRRERILIIQRRGQCQVAPFTGMTLPTTRF